MFFFERLAFLKPDSGISLVSVRRKKRTRRDDLGKLECRGADGGVYALQCLLQGRPHAPRLRGRQARPRGGRGEVRGRCSGVAGRPGDGTPLFRVQGEAVKGCSGLSVPS